MRKPRLLLLCLFVAIAQIVLAQTSWKGTSSTAWRDAANWTNGIPTASVDAIIGDANFTGTNQPIVGSSGSCKSLTLGGTKAVTFTINKNLTVTGNVLINSNATLSLGKATITVNGNWTNNGTFSVTANNSSVIFGGTSQIIGGTSTSSFRKLTINAGSNMTLNRNISVVSGGSMTVNGTLNPSESPTYSVTTPSLTVGATGTLKVNAAAFSGNYSASSISITLNTGSVVDYSSSTTNQDISSALTYSTLRISGTTIKSLTANLPALKSTSSTDGNILVTAGTLDLSSYTANRGISVAGGTFKISAGASLKIGGTGTLPTNYGTYTFALTSNMEYYGSGQTVSAQSYGNLTLSSSSGSVTKTMPSTAFTVQGNLTSSCSSGSLSFTAASNITVNGNFTIGTSTTFNNGASITHTIAGNLVNNGTLTDNSGTINMSGPGTSISGTGTYTINNLGITASNITAAASTVLNIGGNFFTSGEGIFTHLPGGSLNMKGGGKSISGANITLSDLTVDGTISTSSSFVLTGNLTVNSSKSLTATTGTITMSGPSKTIGGAGSIGFSELSVTGSVTTASSFSISSALDIGGSFSASGGTATFTGTSALNGTAHLFNVTLNGTSLKLSTNAILGVASSFTITSGSLDATTSIPNTVTFEGSGAQNVPASSFYNLILATGGTKTATGPIVNNGDLTINPSVTFNGSSYMHSLYGNFINNGSFTPSTSTFNFTGTQDANITGASTFNILTINKTSSANLLSLLDDASAATVNMTNGMINTGSKTLTITTTRSGNGIIIGTIKRQHTFTTGVDYEFESPNNKVKFNSVAGVTSVTETVKLGVISDYPYVSAINREYTLSVPAGTYDANLYLHYDDAELGGNDEATMQLWSNDGNGWSAKGKTGYHTASNYVYLNGITNLGQRWTLASLNNVLRWNGSVSTDWNTPANWTVVQGSPGSLPVANDVVQIGNASFTNQPTISSNVTVKNIEFGSVQAATLTLGAGGSLTTGGNIRGSWSANAVHSINVGAQNLTVNGDLELSDGTTNHEINVTASTGNIVVGGSLTQSGGATVVYSGAGALSIAGNYNYSSGTFSSANSTVTYNGTQSQVVAGVSYNHLNINKAAGTATISKATTINGNCTVTSGTLSVGGTTSIAGDLTINAVATLTGGNTTVSVSGNWNNSGTFVPGSSTVTLNGSGNQSISSTTFNKLNINKVSGTASLTGNIAINGDLTVTSGTLDLGTFTANRTSLGGILSTSSGTTILLSGANNWPSNYTTFTLATNSTVHYNGTGIQTIGGTTYGNLIVSNGGTNAKTLGAMITVAGDLKINSGATLNASAYNISLGGNWINSGTFNAATGTVLLNGSAKTITGNTTFYRVVVYGSYTVAGSDITYDKLLNVTSTGSFEAGTGTAVLNGDLTNSGSLTSSGTTTFSGTTTQTIRLLNALVSTSSGIVNFNGTVSPILNSTSMPTYANLNINNTGGVYPSVAWLVLGNMTIGNGASFNGGISTHNIKGNFTNNGTVTSNGTINFSPGSAVTIAVGNNFNSSGKVIFGGTGAMTITGTPATLTDVVIANTNGASPSSDWNISRSFTINSDALFNAGANNYTVVGDFEGNGTMDGGSSTFTLTSADSSYLTSSAQNIFNHLIIKSKIIANTDVYVASNFTNNGTFDASIAALIMTGSSNSIIGSTTTPLVLNQMINSKDATATTTMNVNISGLSDFEVRSGTFNTATFTISQDPDGGTLKIYDQATLKMGGTNSLPTFNTYVINPLSTVSYAGTNQSILATPSYGNLDLSSNGMATPTGALTVVNNFTFSSGTFAAGNFTHNIGGNWTMTAGSFNNTGSTIQFNGTSDQQIYSTGAFNSVTINKATGLTSLANNMAVNGVLNFVSGKLSLKDYNLNIGTGATISGASESRYIIASGLGSLVQNIVSNGSKVFPVGKTNAYIPATISLSASSTADNFSVRVMDAVYTNGTTGSVMNSYAVNATWLISEGVTGGSDATISLQWPSALELSGFDRNSSRLAHYTANAWEYGTSDLKALGTDPYTITRTAMTSFSPFGVMSYNSAVLPVTWAAVYGKNEGVNNHIYWSTAAEYNNNYFIIQAATDGQNFSEVGRVVSKGNSTNIQDYDYMHKNVASAVTSYRIIQVDFDGKQTYSKVIQLVASSRFNIMLPSGNIFNSSISLNVQVPGNTVGTILISDAGGKVWIQKDYKLNKGGNPISLDLPMSAAGVYFLRLLTTDGYQKVVRFVKN